MTTKRQDKILAYLKAQRSASRDDIAQYLAQVGEQCSKVTLLRDITKLSDAGLVEKSNFGKNTTYAISTRSNLLLPIDIDQYFRKEADDRVLKTEFFNLDIFKELHHLLTVAEITELAQQNLLFQQKRAALTPKLLQKEFERLTVELAWKSSKIEGNTYTLLDTERLLKENVSAAGKTAEETRMVINHKTAIDYILEESAYYKRITVPMCQASCQSL